MFQFKIVPRLFLFASLLGSLPIFVFSIITSQAEVRRARERYEVTAADLQRVDREFQEVEGRLRLLTTSVGAVEQEARRNLRMIRPGETFVVIEREHTR